MLQGLKNLIFEEKPAAAPVQAPPMPRPSAPLSPFQTSVASQQAATPVESVLDVQALTEQIDSLIQSNPALGEYLAFTAKADALASVIADEPTRLKAAAATSGIPKEVLLASIGTVGHVLAQEQANFEAQYVGTAEAAITTLNDQQLAIDQEIQSLNTRLGELAVQKNDVAKDAVTKTSELAKAKIDFTSVMTALNKKYTDAAGKLQLYV